MEERKITEGKKKKKLRELIFIKCLFRKMVFGIQGQGSDSVGVDG